MTYTARLSGERNEMAEFTPINTQDELDAVLASRMSRQETKIRAEYKELEEQNKTLKSESEKWTKEKSDLEAQIAKNKTDYDNLNGKLTEANGTIADYKKRELKTKITIEKGLPMGLREYLKGTTEDEIKASADELGKFANAGRQVPLADPEGDPPSGGSTTASLRGLLKQLHE